MPESAVPNFASDNATRPLGSFTFVLHSHLPYVLSHGTWPHGTDWACEAAAETYIPLLNAFNKLIAEGVTPRVTIGLTPVLCEMLTDRDFIEEFQGYLHTKIEAAQKNAAEFSDQGMGTFRDLSFFWECWYRGVAEDFDKKYNRDIVGAFKKLQDNGQIEVITCAATHGYLPLLGTDESVQAQIAHGVSTYQKHFGRQPRGIWLPECAYRPRYEWKAPSDMDMPDEPPVLRKGVEEFLAENGIEYFIIDAHLLSGGEEIGGYEERFGALKSLHTRANAAYKKSEIEHSPLQPYIVASAASDDVKFFTRHEKTALQVWSGEHGYPGNGHYLDFHKKHFPGGHRLWRVTHSKADLADKLPYEPTQIEQITTEQAKHFAELVKESLQEYKTETGLRGIVCAPYDAELFGHWWFEGPRWLEKVLRELWTDPEIDLTTGGRHLDNASPQLAVALPEGSWGEGGFHHMWLNPENAWTWREIYPCEKKMRDLADAHADSATGDLLTVLKQCARELLLMESSDWQFLISTVSARDYAELRTAGHVNVFQQLSGYADKLIAGGALSEGDRNFLSTVQHRDRAFQDIDLTQWARIEKPAQ